MQARSEGERTRVGVPLESAEPPIAIPGRQPRIRVLQDVFIARYDTISLASVRDIDLKAAGQPRPTTRRAPVSLVLERATGRRSARRIVVPPRLVVRDTAAPPPE